MRIRINLWPFGVIGISILLWFLFFFFLARLAHAADAIPQFGSGKSTKYIVNYVGAHRDKCKIKQRAIQGHNAIKLSCDYTCENPTAIIDAGTLVETVTCHQRDSASSSSCKRGDGCDLTASPSGTESVGYDAEN